MTIPRNHLKKTANHTGSKYILQAYQQVKSKVSYGIRKLRSEYYTKKIEESTDDLKATWKILKEIINEDQRQLKLTKSILTVKLLQTRKLSWRP